MMNEPIFKAINDKVSVSLLYSCIIVILTLSAKERVRYSRPVSHLSVTGLFRTTWAKSSCRRNSVPALFLGVVVFTPLLAAAHSAYKPHLPWGNAAPFEWFTSGGKTWAETRLSNHKPRRRIYRRVYARISNHKAMRQERGVCTLRLSNQICPKINTTHVLIAGQIILETRL